MTLKAQRVIQIYMGATHRVSVQWQLVVQTTSFKAARLGVVALRQAFNEGRRVGCAGGRLHLLLRRPRRAEADVRMDVRRKQHWFLHVATSLSELFH